MNLKALSRQYPIDKPKPALQLVLLALITVGGLIALFFAAFASFQIATGNQAQAFFAALVIEVGLAVEALALIKRPKTVYPWVGLTIAYIVSASYNWFQAANHATAVGQNVSTFTLGALAFGPLSALAFLSLTLGYELREHQWNVSEWERKRMEWTTQEAARLEEKEAAERLHQEELAERERKRQERAEKIRQEQGEQKTVLRTLTEKLERSPEYDELLGKVRELSAGNSFRADELQQWLNRQKTATYELIKYGKETGQLHQIGHGKYMTNGNGHFNLAQ